MIAYLKGEVTHKDGAQVWIECAGVGYAVRASLQTLARLDVGQTVRVYTWLQVREDAHTLYGFIDLDEKGSFEQLIGVNGVGANTALAVLSTLSVAELAAAVRDGDRKRLVGVRGVGGKTADRILLELRDRLTAPESTTNPQDPVHAIRNEALLALQSLGFARSAVEGKIDAYLRACETPPKVEELIRQGLKS